MKQFIYLFTLVLSFIIVPAHVEAMSDASQMVVVTSTAGLINAGTAVYMQGQGMNPQYVMLPNGMPTVVPGSSVNPNGQGASPANNYNTQNDQGQKQAFFNDDQ